MRTAEGNVHSVIPAPSEVHLATFFSGCVMEKVRPGQHLLSQSGEQFVHIVTVTELHVLRSDEDTSDRHSVLSSESLLSPSVCVLVCIYTVSFVVVDVDCTRFSSLGNWVNGLRSLTQFSYPAAFSMMTAENF